MTRSRPQGLRAEHRDDAWGIGVAAPTELATPAGSGRQLAYEIRRDQDAAVRVESDEHVLVPWPGPPLTSHEGCSITVRVLTDLGLSDWSTDDEPRALDRVWRAHDFSAWMTQMLHLSPGGTPFDLRRQLGEPENFVATRAGRTCFAEQYTGWPSGDPA